MRARQETSRALDASRAQRTSRATAAMTRVVAFLTILAAAACGDSTGPEDLALSGDWIYEQNFSAAIIGLSCTSGGTMTIAQNGSRFDGTYVQTGTCTVQGDEVDNSSTGDIDNGLVTGMAIAFQTENCDYNGTVNAQPATSVSGTVTCRLNTGSESLTIAGSWSATKS